MLVAVVAVVTGCGVDFPDDGAATAPTVRIGGIACVLRPITGSGVAVGGDLVVTNAHVVRGADELFVDVGGQRRADVEVVAFDGRVDLALLRVPGLDAPPVVLERPRAGDRARLAGFTADGTPTERPVTVRRNIIAAGEDIDRNPGARRAAVELDADIEPGLSGAGIYGADGAVHGIVFASSRRQGGLGYAVAAAEVVTAIDALGDPAAAPPVDRGTC